MSATSPESWLKTLEAKEREIANLFNKMEARQAELEKVHTSATAATTSSNTNSANRSSSNDLENVKEDLTRVLNEKFQLTEELKAAKRALEQLQRKYTDEVSSCTADMAKVRQDADKSESDLDFLRNELDRVLLECENWKALATQNPIPEPGTDANKDVTIANLKTELEIVNKAKSALACQLERKASMEKRCGELARELQEHKEVVENLNTELAIVNKTKTVLELQRGLDDTIETGYTKLKAEVETLRSELEIVRKTNSTLSAQLESIQTEHEALREAMEGQELTFARSIKDMTSDCAQKIADISLLHDKLDAISREKDDLTAQIQSLYRDLEKEKKAHGETRFHMEQEAHTAANSAAQKDAAIKSLEDKLRAVSKEKEGLVSEINRLNGEIQRLRDECAAKADELASHRRAEEEERQASSQAESSVAQELERTRAELQSALDRCRLLALENETHKSAAEAKDINLRSLQDQMASMPLAKALEGSHDELLSALRREMERKNNYIDELSAKVVQLEGCNNELLESVRNGGGSWSAAPGNDGDAKTLAFQLKSKSQELDQAREEYEKSMRDKEQRFDNTLHELQRQVESAKSFKDVADTLQRELEKREKEFEVQFEILKESQLALGHEPAADPPAATPDNDRDEQTSQLKAKLAECQSTCNARLESMAQEYEKKLEIFVQQLNDNLVDQEKELSERLENEFNDRLRRECLEMEGEYQKKLDRMNSQWEKRLQAAEGKRILGQEENRSGTPETSQIRILQTRVQELQNALNSSHMAAMEGDEKDEIYQGRIRELVTRLAEMEAEKSKLRQKIDALNKTHSEEIQSYIHTVQSCLETEPDLNRQVEQMRKIHRRELAQVQVKLRNEYEAKFQELKTKFEEKLVQVKESMHRNGSSTGTVVTPRALSPITEIDDMNQFAAIFGEFLQDVRGCGEFPDGFCDKLTILKSRAEQLYLTMRRETLGALETEQKRVREMEDEWEDKLNAMEERHQQELARLTEDYNAHKRDMEYASQAAMAAVQSGTTSLDVLKQQLLDKQKEIHQLRKKHRSELKQLRRMMDKNQKPTESGSEGDEDEDAVKITYLRDILFQYMTGRNSRTLARMIAAVVNFTPEQIEKVVEHESRRREGSRLRSPSAPRHASPQKR